MLRRRIVIGINQRSIFDNTPEVHYEYIVDYCKGIIELTDLYHALSEIGITYGPNNYILYGISRETDKYIDKQSSDLGFQISGWIWWREAILASVIVERYLVRKLGTRKFASSSDLAKFPILTQSLIS